jgi:hypothetical protein
MSNETEVRCSGICMACGGSGVKNGKVCGSCGGSGR